LPRLTVGTQRPFDLAESREFAEVRQRAARDLLRSIAQETKLLSALDVGCGVGYFSKFLADLGFQVAAIDGREENVIEARRRYPEIDFQTRNAEELSQAEIGTYDLVLCFGLLYHLENPFRAIRNLHSVTNRVLLLESMCAPGDEPSLQLLDEYHADDQGLSYVAFYPTESCLVKMLYRAGFPFVYRLTELPDHEFYRATPSHKRRRAMLVAAKQRFTLSELKPMPEPVRPWDIWPTAAARWKSRLRRIPTLVRTLVPRRGKVGSDGAKA